VPAWPVPVLPAAILTRRKGKNGPPGGAVCHSAGTWILWRLAAGRAEAVRLQGGREAVLVGVAAEVVGEWAV